MSLSSELIATQLEAVASRLIGRVFQTVYKHGPVEAPELYGLVRHRDLNAWAADPTEALYAAIAEAAGMLPDEPVRPGAKLTWRQAAIKLFNLERLDLDHWQGQRYNKLAGQMFAADETLKYTSNDVKKKITSEVRALLAKQLIDLFEPKQEICISEGVAGSLVTVSGALGRRDPDAADFLEPEDAAAIRVPARHAMPVAVISELLAGEPAYEPRPKYHAAFAQLVRQGEHLIVLSGDRGNGKSRLALELISRQSFRAADDFAYFFAESEATLIRDLRAALSARRIGYAGFALQDIAPGFAELVCSPDAPTWVVLDNVEDEALIAQLLPRGLRSTLVITSSVALPAYERTSIKVNPMEVEEARRLVARLLPRENQEGVERLAEELGNRPLPIVHACGFIAAESQVTTEAFLNDLRHHLLDTLDDVADDRYRSLTAIYDRTLKALQRHKRTCLAADILELVAYLSISEDIPERLLLGGVRARRAEQGGVGITAFGAALGELERRYLITRHNGAVSIHPLTRDLIGHLLIEDASATCRVLLTAFHEDLKDFSPGQALPPDKLDILRYALWVGITSVMLPIADPSVRMEMDHFLAVLLSGFTQLGVKEGVEVVATVAKVILKTDPAHSYTRMPKAVEQWISAEFSLGVIDSQRQLFLVEQSVNPGLPFDESWLARAPLRHILWYAKALVDACQYQRAIEILYRGDVYSKVDDASSDPVKQEQAANYAELMADSYAGIGAWRRAMDGYWYAHHKLLNTSSDPYTRSRSAVRVARSMVNVALMAGWGGYPPMPEVLEN